MQLWSSSILLEFLAFVPQGSLVKPLAVCVLVSTVTSRRLMLRLVGYATRAMISRCFRGFTH